MWELETVMIDIEFEDNEDNQVVPDIGDKTGYIDSRNEERTVPNIKIKTIIATTSKDSEEDQEEQVVPHM